MSLPNELHPLQLAASSGGYDIEQSLRFNSADSAYLSRTPGSAGNRKTWTWSGWVKRSTDGRLGIWSAGITFGPGTPACALYYNNSSSNNTLEWIIGGSADGQYITNARYRDYSSWYHIVIAYDSANGTASERFRIFVNGERATCSTQTMTQNFESDVNNTVRHTIGARSDDGSPGTFFNGYLAEINFIDGSALTPSSFGETDPDTGAWIPKRYTGSYGTNGFYLKFDPTATNGIGHDHSGNGNNFTATGFSTSGTGTDVMSDTPTTNWCTLNPLIKPATSSNVPTNGNLEITSVGGGYDQIRVGTIMISSGKWYWEYRMEGTYNYGGAGLIDPTIANFYSMMASSTPNPDYTGGFKRQQNGNTYSTGVTTVATPSISNGDVAMFAVDYNTGKVWVGTAGTWYNSGDPAAGTNPTLTIQTLTNVVPFFSPTDSGSQQYIVNFGQRAFEYTPPTGFKALNTSNLPEPTIKDGGKYFDTVLWTGNQTARTISMNSTFTPDFIWIKNRTSGYNHSLQDVVRGFGPSTKLNSNTTAAENSANTEPQAGYVNSAAAGSFDIDASATATWYHNNLNSNAYVAWCWDAGGAGSSNNAGTITSTISANASAGFSIVTYTGAGSAGTVGHGLGVAPSFVITKDRDSTYDWYVYHKDLTSQYYLKLNGTAAQAYEPNIYSSAPSSTVINYGSSVGVTRNTAKYVAYCFSEVAGYSKFGKYTGNGSTTDGPFIWCGFTPRWILIKWYKDVSTAESWHIYDTARQTYNANNTILTPDSSVIEETPADRYIDILSNGFKLRQNGQQINRSGASYIFAAFAELPFKYANAR